MPKNKGKGGKNRRRGKNDNEDEKRELVFKEDGQEYAQVKRMLGNGRQGVGGGGGGGECEVVSERLCIYISMYIRMYIFAGF
mmetsp:Transcript_3953/g.16813  ORF Transcript_3953/g.16813 Transcript_3953/m.16813 type:complete len:82 (-) Transcript_3953:177-422(-)